MTVHHAESALTREIKGFSFIKNMRYNFCRLTKFYVAIFYLMEIIMLDDDEKQIIRLLQDDGRMSTADIARRLKVSEPTVRKKLNRVIGEGLIKIRAIADPVELGFRTPVYIGLVVERSKIEYVANELKNYSFIDSVTISTGPNDITIYGCFESPNDVYKFLFEELVKYEGIKETDTTLVFKNVKSGGFKGVVGIVDTDGLQKPRRE